MSEPTAGGIRRVLRWEERLVQMMQRIAEDVLPDPVRYDDLTPEIVRDAFIRDHAVLRAKVEEQSEQVSLFRRKCMEFGWDSAGDPIEWLNWKFEELMRKLAYHKSRWNPASSQLAALEQERDEARSLIQNDYKALWEADSARLAESETERSDSLRHMLKLEARLAKVVEAASALVQEMGEIQASPEYQAVWTLAMIHGAPYKGRNWKAKYERLCAALAAARGEEGK
jgi:hypothetical protein